MIVWGGRAGPFSSGPYLGSGGRYDPGTDSWLPISEGVGAPPARGDHTATWTGSEMIVWGGWNGVLADGGARYNPTTDTWVRTVVPMPPAGVPSPRYRHTAIWTGSEMIVWGGRGESNDLDSGGRYRPATDDWLPTATGPAGHSGHSAVWSGTEMLVVWGGHGPPPSTEDGSRYNPATNTWTSFGPATILRRTDANAVWTGTELVVWGGLYNNSCAVQEGARFNPVSGTWILMPNGPLIPRSSYAGLWSGDRFLGLGGIGIPTGCPGTPGAPSDHGRFNPATNSWASTTPSFFGGRPTNGVWTGSEAILSTGASCARYNPTSDIWSASCLGPNSPSSRDGSTMIWTGSKALVWGGQGFSPAVIRNDGGLYDPSSNAWLAVVGGPSSAHSSHSAVWTGSQMIIWGGFDSPSTLTNNGAAYCGCANPSTAYVDTDLDGWGSSTMAATCNGETPAGTSALTGDCNDQNPAIHPATPELCNGVDDDCNSVVDDILPTVCADSTDCTNDVCQSGACAHVPDAFRCQDSFACTIDTCDPVDGCHHVANHSACNDGIPCTTDTCDLAIGCTHAVHDSMCDDGIACTVDACSLVDGCGHAPDDALCADQNPCSSDVCDPTAGCVHGLSGACDHDPRDVGYWRAVCAAQIPGVALTSSDLACVSGSCTFASVNTVSAMCARLRPTTPGDVCQQADAQLMAVLLNRCVARVGGGFPIDSACEANGPVDQSVQEADAIQCNFREPAFCDISRCETAEIATGRALDTMSLRLAKDPAGTRLDWSPPYSPDLGPPTNYEVWRRTGGAGAFTLEYETSGLSWTDPSGAARAEYEIRYSWSP